MNTDRNTQKGKSLRGRAAELRVMSELMMRGVSVIEPEADMGVDFFVCERSAVLGIQVKSALADRRGRYAFVLRRHRYPKDTEPRFLSGSVDFVVCLGIDENRFWVIPAHRVKKTTRITLGPDYNQPENVKWKPEVTKQAILSLRSQGLTFGQVAEQVGLNLRSVFDRITPRRNPKKRAGFACVLISRDCENAWHFILDAISTAKQVDEIKLAEMEKNPCL